MPIVHRCATRGCETLTMGDHCLACEQADDAAEFDAYVMAAPQRAEQTYSPDGAEPVISWLPPSAAGLD